MIRTVRRHCATATIAAVTTMLTAALFAAELSAQDTARTLANVSKQRYCWRGQPKPACDAFLLTEFAYFRSIVTPTARGRYSFSTDLPQNYYEIRDANWNFAWEIGAMQNVSSSTGIGATMLFGLNEDGGSVGLKARYRRWLNAEGIALDVGAGVRTSDGGRGVVIADTAYLIPYRPPGQVLAFTGDVAINARDYVSLVTRVDIVKFGGRYQPNVALGVRAGSKPAAFGTAGLATTYAVLLAVLFSVLDD